MCAKADVLDAGGYMFDYRYGTYVNVRRKTVFSHLFLNAHTAEEIEAHIARRAQENSGWEFFSLNPLHPSVFDKIIGVYSGRVRSDR